MESSYIVLNNVRFHAYHGVGVQEALVGNEFTVNLRLKVDMSRAMASDEVTDTVSYADVYETLKAEMAHPSRLLERVAGRMVEQLFRQFPTVEAVELTLMKRNPPMGADIESAGVEIIRSR